jgi:hypothetical protein
VINPKINLFHTKGFFLTELYPIIQTSKPKKYLLLIAISLLVVSISWSIQEQSTFKVMNEARLIYFNRVVSFPLLIEGRLRTLDVHIGDFISREDALATTNTNETSTMPTYA